MTLHCIPVMEIKLYYKDELFHTAKINSGYDEEETRKYFLDNLSIEVTKAKK